MVLISGRFHNTLQVSFYQFTFASPPCPEVPSPRCHQPSSPSLSLNQGFILVGKWGTGQGWKGQQDRAPIQTEKEGKGTRGSVPLEPLHCVSPEQQVTHTAASLVGPCPAPVDM